VALSRNPRVRYAEPNYLLTIDAVPDDPLLGQLWGLINTGQTGGTPDADIDADLAWGLTTGSQDVVVGVIDTGVDYKHPDLAANIWTNPGEIPDNGIDDDGNGYVDDVHGYNFIYRTADPMDDHGHGTHVSGTIGAIGDNGIGVAGVNWHVSIMPLKFLGSDGGGDAGTAAEAVDYSVMMGAQLTSNSWGGGEFSQTLYDAIAAAGAHDRVFVAAAGNNGRNTDLAPIYPGAFDLPNIISVAATDSHDLRASFSNYGVTTVDLGAPGVDILSTFPGNGYAVLSGTSMATPHVAGACALVLSLHPGLSAANLKSILLHSVDPLPSLAGVTVSGGRLNVFRAIAEPDSTPPAGIEDLATGTPTSNTMRLTWTATGDDGETGKAASYDLRYSTAPIDASSFDTATRVAHPPFPSPAGTPESTEVPGLAAGTTYYFALEALDEWGNTSPLSNMAVGTTLPPPTGQVLPPAISDALATGERAQHVVTLGNVGLGTLDFTVPIPDLAVPLADRHAPPIPSKGGPDAFGYRWVDSDQPGGPAFDWVDVASTGTPIATLFTDDGNSGPIPLSFVLPFYGEPFQQIHVSANGWLSFTSDIGGTFNGWGYLNGPLPFFRAPENLAAPFWDDLTFNGAVRAYFQDFGDRAVVEWLHVDRYGGGSDLTFEAILHADGAVEFQYQTLAGVVTSATVGIQNSTKSVGLKVAFNQPYLHDRLTVRMVPVPQWVTVSPASGRLGAGESIPLNVALNAFGLDAGAYGAAIRIPTNDPLRPVLDVAATLDVSGAPDVEVKPETVAFGDDLRGLRTSATLRVRNVGSEVLHVTGITSSAPSVLVAAPAAFDLTPHAAQYVTVSWTPDALGPFAESLTIASDDAGDPALSVPVTGNGVPEPVVTASPASFSDTLHSGEHVVRTLSVENVGGTDLTVDASADLGPGTNAGVAPGGDIVPLASGGPDPFGYRWRDSDEPGGPVFDWVDISAAGTPVSFPSIDDGVSAPIDMPLPFPFYGRSVSRLWISTNGWIAFTQPANSDLSNDHLPSTAGPRNVVGLFWDDLHQRGGSVRTLFDRSRFIVQFTGYGRVTPAAGVDLTFEAILYPSGRIVCQYLTMSGAPLDSATIGIQNDARTTGLTMVHNAAYVHDRLAVEITRTPDWLTVFPPHAVIPAGASQPFQVTLDATGRGSGQFEGAVVLATNAPASPSVRLPATLEVIGSAVPALYPAAYDFGTVFTGYPALATFELINNGTELLGVAGVVSTDPDLVVGTPIDVGPKPAGGFVLGPGEAQLFTLRWAPGAPRTMDAEVNLYGDDPATPVASLPVRGEALPPPAASWSPASITESLRVGDVVHRTLHLENQGGSDLTFEENLRAAGGPALATYEALESKEPGVDPRPGILGTGGPDAYGYTFKDSDEPGGPAFEWIDIDAVGTPISFGASGACDDCGSAPLPLGFSFPFYGRRFDAIRATTNGWLSFTSVETTGPPQPLPSDGDGVPENLVALFWSDLVQRDGTGPEPRRSTVATFNDGTRFIAQYDHFYRVGHYDDDLTFQVVLYPSGRIVYQYLTTAGATGASTIGIQNAARNDALLVAFNAAYVHDGLAVAIQSPFDYLRIAPGFGVVPPGGSVDLDVAIDLRDRIGGDYTAGLDLLTNDPARGLVTVPVSLHVTGVPVLQVNPAALSFQTTFVGYRSEQSLVLHNSGTDVLTISGRTLQGDFDAATIDAPVPLPVGGDFALTVGFAPTSPGVRAGDLILHSNDPATPDRDVALRGEALIPPVAAALPEALSTALPPAGSRTKTLTLRNDGGSDLTWTLATGADWLAVAPYAGTIPAGGSAPLTVTLDAARLEDGRHETTVGISSNDPRTPLLRIPVGVNVGFTAPDYVAIDPAAISRTSNGGAIKVIVQLPPGLDPRSVDPCGVRLDAVVPVIGCPGTPPQGAVQFADAWPVGGDGVPEIALKFDRQAVLATLGAGGVVTIVVEGEVTDVAFWRGGVTARAIAGGKP
jgi:subtilisin family serine protease